MKINHSLLAISPIDGRYAGKTKQLVDYFSEYALFKYRVWVEVEYFIALCELPLPQLKDFPKAQYETLRNLYRNFNPQDAQKIKDHEAITNHDVKATEYFIKDVMEKEGLGDYLEFVHFGLTSQDINNTAVPMSLMHALQEETIPQFEELIERIDELASKWKNIPMLARTHGQPASPTNLGKELKVFSERLTIQLNQLKNIPFSAKFGGATGNFNAHQVAYPQTDWVAFANKFVNETLGLSRSQTTTQIEHYDNLAATFDALKRLNNIVLDLDRDIWTYISMDYFKQKIKKGEVGSSAMPHKVNPIDFENSEGNIGIANAIYEHLAAKLPVSRLQRDLTDSTVLRNVGVPVAHTAIALKATSKGLSKLVINQEKIAADLEQNWAVVAEGIQTILRREQFPKPYEALKDLTRKHGVITSESIRQFIETLDVSDDVKKELKRITPENYTGVNLAINNKLNS
jgi:adenylosuccinate lyase